jgi:hypothetical protein
MALYILTFTFLDSRRDDKRLWTNTYKILVRKLEVKKLLG